MYRFSISWSRILPTGRGAINQAGIDHYVDEIQQLKRAGIEPLVTLYHWDLPQALQDQGGWLNISIVDDFTNYADICFKYFGPMVKYWLTFNEPWVFNWLGYGVGVHAPGQCSNRQICPTGNSDVDPYVAAHNVLLAHASVYRMYHAKYQGPQGGKISITLSCDWGEPFSNSTADVQAAQRYLEFFLGWFADPIYKDGDYPPSMKQSIGSRLPAFTPEQQTLLKGSADFFWTQPVHFSLCPKWYSSRFLWVGKRHWNHWLSRKKWNIHWSCCRFPLVVYCALGHPKDISLDFGTVQSPRDLDHGEWHECEK